MAEETSKKVDIQGDLHVKGNISTDSTKLDKSLLDMIYPVGTLYWTNLKSFDPNTSFGGKWTRIQDKFILAANATSNTLPAENATGKIELSVDQLPAHTHGMAHTHTYSGTSSEHAGHTHNMDHWHDLQNHTHSFTSDPHHHFVAREEVGQWSQGTSSSRAIATIGHGGNNNWGEYSLSKTKTSDEANRGLSSDTTVSGTTKGPSTNESGWAKNNSSTHIVNTGSSGKHAHTYSGRTTDAKVGSTDTARANTDSTGSTSEINIMPPYVAKYCWERNAD